MTSNMICIVALGVGFKCPRKIHLNTQCPQVQVGLNGFIALAIIWTLITLTVFIIMIKWNIILDSVALI